MDRGVPSLAELRRLIASTTAMVEEARMDDEVKRAAAADSPDSAPNEHSEAAAAAAHVMEAKEALAATLGSVRRAADFSAGLLTAGKGSTLGDSHEAFLQFKQEMAVGVLGPLRAVDLLDLQLTQALTRAAPDHSPERAPQRSPPEADAAEGQGQEQGERSNHSVHNSKAEFVANVCGLWGDTTFVARLFALSALTHDVDPRAADITGIVPIGQGAEPARPPHRRRSSVHRLKSQTSSPPPTGLATEGQLLECCCAAATAVRALSTYVVGAADREVSELSDAALENLSEALGAAVAEYVLPRVSPQAVLSSFSSLTTASDIAATVGCHVLLGAVSSAACLAQGSTQESLARLQQSLDRAVGTASESAVRAAATFLHTTVLPDYVGQKWQHHSQFFGGRTASHAVRFTASWLQTSWVQPLARAFARTTQTPVLAAAPHGSSDRALFVNRSEIAASILGPALSIVTSLWHHTFLHTRPSSDRLPQVLTDQAYLIRTVRQYRELYSRGVDATTSLQGMTALQNGELGRTGGPPGEQRMPLGTGSSRGQSPPQDDPIPAPTTTAAALQGTGALPGSAPGPAAVSATNSPRPYGEDSASAANARTPVEAGVLASGSRKSSATNVDIPGVGGKLQGTVAALDAVIDHRLLEIAALGSFLAVPLVELSEFVEARSGRGAANAGESSREFWDAVWRVVPLSADAVFPPPDPQGSPRSSDSAALVSPLRSPLACYDPCAATAAPAVKAFGDTMVLHPMLASRDTWPTPGCLLPRDVAAAALVSIPPRTPYDVLNLRTDTTPFVCFADGADDGLGALATPGITGYLPTPPAPPVCVPLPPGTPNFAGYGPHDGVPVQHQGTSPRASFTVPPAADGLYSFQAPADMPPPTPVADASSVKQPEPGTGTERWVTAMPFVTVQPCEHDDALPVPSPMVRQALSLRWELWDNYPALDEEEEQMAADALRRVVRPERFAEAAAAETADLAPGEPGPAKEEAAADGDGE